MARDRKRAKQRRDRGRAPAVSRGPSARAEAGAAAPAADTPAADAPAADAPEEHAGGIVRPDIPGSLDHASADVDEFEGALVRGAGGVPAENELAEQAFGEDEQADSAEDVLEAPADGGRGGAGTRGPGGGGGRGGGETPSGAPIRGGNRAIGFIRASWAELQRVQWPDRRQVAQATAVVLGFVAIAGAYLGVADFVAKEIVELVIG